MVLIDFFSSINKQLKKSWQLIPDKSVTERLVVYMELGIPGALMLCFEWWLFEILAILAGLISVEALAAEVIIVTIVSFTFMIPLGCSFAASAFTGFFCASGKPLVAKRYARLTLAFGMLLNSLQVLMIYIFSKGISRVFTQDE